MEIQGFAIILFIITLHILALNIYSSKSKSGYKEGFSWTKMKTLKFNCGDCFQKKKKISMY